MKEYRSLIEEYSLDKYFLYTRIISEKDWGNKEIAEKYLEKYWLFQSEYESVWKYIQKQIFINLDKTLPAIMFNKHYEMIAFRGGCLFFEEDFKQLQQCLLALREKYFVVIENTFEGKLEEPALRMKFPVDITWEELTSGNFISSVLFEMFHNDYFVFGESGVWGRYCANDYESPLNIIGFKPEYADLFKSNFKVSEDERKEIIEWLPDNYKQYIK